MATIVYLNIDLYPLLLEHKSRIHTYAKLFPVSVAGGRTGDEIVNKGKDARKNIIAEREIGHGGNEPRTGGAQPLADRLDVLCRGPDAE